VPLSLRNRRILRRVFVLGGDADADKWAESGGMTYPFSPHKFDDDLGRCDLWTAYVKDRLYMPHHILGGRLTSEWPDGRPGLAAYSAA
jgi:hypothetical protein